jgi:hypothetical protein
MVLVAAVSSSEVEMQEGRPICGWLSSADQSTAAAIPFYEMGGDTSGGQTAITLAVDEFVNITDIVVVYAANDTVHVFLNDDQDGTPDVGEYVIGGTVAANGGIAKSFMRTPRSGAAGAIPYLVTGAAGQVDVAFTGFITKG